MSASESGDRRSELAGHLAHGVRHRRWYSSLDLTVLWLVVTFVAALLADAIVPGFHVDFPFGPLGFAVVLGISGLALQPLLVAGAVRLGWMGSPLLALGGQGADVIFAARA